MPALELPPVDDRRLWEVWMSMYHFPTLTAADDLGLFPLLDREPLTAEEVATALGLSARATEALLGVLTALGLLVQRGGRFHLEAVTRHYLLPTSPYYWGGMLRFIRDTAVTRTTLKEVLVRDRPRDGSMSGMWEKHEMDPAQARGFTEAMHARSLHLGVAVAQRVGLGGARRVLDVAGGSGCFSIALARQHAGLRCTVLELEAVAAVARETIARFGVADRVEVVVADMFGGAWPTGHDVVFFSNIFHDWDRPLCVDLARRAWTALPAGGQILLHELLLEDTKDGPLVAATDSMHMVFFTEGKQRTAAEFESILHEAGFTAVEVIPTYGYYSVVRARRP